MSTVSVGSGRMRDDLESGGSFCNMPPLDAMWDSLHVTSSGRSHPLHNDSTSLYKSRPKHRQRHNQSWPPLPRYAFRASSTCENSIATCSDRQLDVHASSPKNERSADTPRSKEVPPSLPNVSTLPVPPPLPSAAPQQPPSMPSSTVPLGSYMVAGPWASALHPHVPLVASGHLPPVGMPTQFLTHSMLPTTSPPVMPLVMYNSPQPLMGVMGAGGMQVPLPSQEDSAGELNKVDQNFNVSQLN